MRMTGTDIRSNIDKIVGQAKDAIESRDIDLDGWQDKAKTLAGSAKDMAIDLKGQAEELFSSKDNPADDAAASADAAFGSVADALDDVPRR